MKSPAELKAVLSQRWESPAKREAYLLGGSDLWPLVLSIGRPKPKVMRDELDAVKRHVESWRRVAIGEVVWKSIRYRSTATPVDVPVQWQLCHPSEWIAACADQAVLNEFDTLSQFVEQTDTLFHSLLVRRRSLWRNKPVDEVLQATRLALSLEPLCAEGRPLRVLSLEGIDTKFFERNSHLVTSLLDARFDGEVSCIGLETFLGALPTGEHWLLVVDLDGSLLPYRKLRVPRSELHRRAFPGKRLLIVENESCQHQLPVVPDTIAVLGTGFDLSWTDAEWLAHKQVAYWGDIDTWGLQFLATVRTNMPHVEALLMTPDTFDRHADAAVAEPVIAGTEIPSGLNKVERQLYHRLLTEPRGRLEQEFLSVAIVRNAIFEWSEPQ